MINKIKENIDNPQQLESLYRSNEKEFKSSFFDIYNDIKNEKIAIFWQARLEYQTKSSYENKSIKYDIFFLILICVIMWLLLKISIFFNFYQNPNEFYERNIGLLVMMGLSTYIFVIKPRINPKHLIFSTLIFVASAVYINILPTTASHQTLDLAKLHIPLFLWCIYGLIFIDFDFKNIGKRIDFVKYNGDLLILVTLITIAGGILSSVTIVLFSAINLQIHEFYFENIMIFGVVSTPIVATYILKNHPSISNKIANIIANIFAPLVLITLLVYLISILSMGKSPYYDRDFLIVFNLLLLGVMAIIVFSVSELSSNNRIGFVLYILLALSALSLIVNIIALSAVLFRLGEFGFTPNKIVVLGSNLLILGNIVLVMIEIFNVIFKHKTTKTVNFTFAKYLPLYLCWTFIVTFIFPFIFSFI